MVLLLFPPTSLLAVPLLRVVKASQAGTNLLQNGRFDQIQAGQPAGWRAAPQGFRFAPGEGRNGSAALACDSPAQQGWHGASQSLALNRSAPFPLVLRGWSRAEQVTGSPDSGYSLYLDLVYQDDTPLWGQTANFPCGTHDWVERQIVIMPEKPVKSLTLHCLLRSHAGQAWFDDVSLSEIQPQGDAFLFQGLPVQVETKPPESDAAPQTLRTQDQLALTLRDQRVVSLQVSGEELAGHAPSGFLVRDVAENSDFHSFAGGLCPELQLKLQAEFLARNNHLLVQGRLEDTRGRDRAVTLLFALPIDALGWNWGDDIQRRRLIEGRGEFSHTVNVGCGATGTLSLYPVGAIWSSRTGLALALDMGRPAQYRLAYHAGTRQLFIAYDFGLVPETRNFPGSADFRFVLFHFPPEWGFRAAFQKLAEIFPDHFAVRSKEQGIWMPFTDVSTVENWADFGFKYHEGNNNVAFDDAQGILSFRYTEPMTWWMRMDPGTPRTAAEAIRQRDQVAQEGRGAQRRLAEASVAAGMLDAQAQPCLLFRDTPWCDGAVWSLNPNPHLPAQPNAASVHWNEQIETQLYGQDRTANLDGEYLDSLEGYVTADLNFRRDHFGPSTVPLTFATDSRRPALFKGLAVFEFTRWISDEVHRLGKLTFANGVPYRFTFLCPWLDVMGTETDWLRQRRYSPASHSQMALWRTLSGQKPYLLLMNTDYDAFTPDLVEKYFQRSLFYGFFPSMFSHNASENPYWKNPRWHNRDRPLFKKYIPIVRRVAQAGWQPVTAARSQAPGLLVERFGPDRTGTVYFTLFNDTANPQTAQVQVERELLGLPAHFQAEELVSGRPLRLAESTCSLQLQPQTVAVLRLNRASEP